MHLKNARTSTTTGFRAPVPLRTVENGQYTQMTAREALFNQASRRTVWTVFFSDLESFSSLSETLAHMPRQPDDVRSPGVGAKQTSRRSAATSVFDRSGHRRQIKSNGLSEAGSIEKMSADCARLKPSAGLIDCISKARSIAQSRENPLGWAAEWFLTHAACHGIGSILATVFPARSGFVAALQF
jgi:hypothetical protein